MTDFTPRDPDFARRVRESFDRQRVMRLLGAELTKVEPGLVEIELPYRRELSQQHGFFHAGVIGTIADSAGGYSAYTLMPAGASVLTVEYKLSFLSPAGGERVVAQGRVTKPGRTLTFCELDVAVVKNGKAKPCARGLQTVICLQGRTVGSGPG